MPSPFAGWVLYDFSPTSFEVMLAIVTSSRRSSIIANIYRPPNLSPSCFLEELADLVIHINATNLILCNDFNCPGGRLECIIDDLKRLNTALSSLNITSHHLVTRTSLPLYQLLTLVLCLTPMSKNADSSPTTGSSLQKFELVFHEVTPPSDSPNMIRRRVTVPP